MANTHLLCSSPWVPSRHSNPTDTDMTLHAMTCSHSFTSAAYEIRGGCAILCVYLCGRDICVSMPKILDVIQSKYYMPETDWFIFKVIITNQNGKSSHIERITLKLSPWKTSFTCIKTYCVRMSNIWPRSKWLVHVKFTLQMKVG